MSVPRAPNNPLPAITVLEAIRQIIVPNTRLTLVNPNDPTGLSQVYVRRRYDLMGGAFPAVNLQTGQQQFKIWSNRVWAGILPVLIEYYDRWDRQPSTIDDIRIRIDTDIEAIKANLENNNALVVNGTANAVSVPEILISPDLGEIETRVPGVFAVYRTITAHVQMMPYDT